MNEIDFAILTIIVISLLIGLLRGFFKEIISLISWGVAIWVGFTFSRGFSVLLETMIDIPTVRIAAAFVILVLLSLIVISVINYFVELLLEKIGLTGVDRFLGVLLGIIRGILVVTIIVMLTMMTPVQEHALWQESSFIPFFQTLAVWLQEHSPSDIMTL